jgi:hypothetical protein
MTTSVLILQLAVLGVVLESDLGRKRVGWFRVLRPVITIVLIVPFFFTSLPTSGRDLLLQGAGALAGVLLGLFSMCPWFVSVGYDPAWRSRWFHRNRPPREATVSRAGAGYALVWIAVTAARLGFAYGSQHLFAAPLGHFLAAHQLSGTALTNAFIFLSIGMDLFRSLLLAARARRVRSSLPAPVAAATAGQPSPGRVWAGDLLSIPLVLLGSRVNRQLDRRQDRLDRHARRRP